MFDVIKRGRLLAALWSLDIALANLHQSHKLSIGHRYAVILCSLKVASPISSHLGSVLHDPLDICLDLKYLEIKVILNEHK